MILEKNRIVAIALGGIVVLLWFKEVSNLETLFSGLAFVGVIYAILLQSHELELQREMLTQTKDELKRSAIAQEQSQIAFTRQLEAMNKTALLHGYSAKLDHHSAELKWHANQSHQPEMNVHREAANKADKKVTDLIDDIEKVIDDYRKERNSLKTGA